MPTTEDLQQQAPLDGTIEPTMPVVCAADLRAGRWSEATTDVLSTCRRFGFLAVDLTAAQQETLTRTLDAFGGFVALDDAIKAQVRDEGDVYGWTPSYSEPAYQPGTVSNVESYDIEKPLVMNRDDRHWPHIEGFREAVLGCWNECLDLGDDILELVARAAGLESGFLTGRCGTRDLNTLRLLHYPMDRGHASKSKACIPHAPGREVGIAAHTDFECITLIYQTAPGLEIRRPDGRWQEVPVAPGRIVVLIDDMLERWTNGHLQATGHRVRRTPYARYSIVMFMAVDRGVEVAPLSAFVSPLRPAAYTRIDQEAHINNEMHRARRQLMEQHGRVP